MAQLIDLSTELLIDILHHIPPEDLEATSGCCRLLYRVTRPFLNEHRKELEKQYKKCMPPVIEDGSDDREAWNDNFKGWYTGLLCTVITDKRLGGFLKELKVISQTWDLVRKNGGWIPNQTFPGALPDFTKTRRQPRARTFMHISEQALYQSKLIPQDEKLRWLKGLKNGNQVLAVALLLENLPALSAITINLEYGENVTESDQLLKWFERVAAEHQSHSSLHTPVSLPCQNLTIVHLEFNSGEWRSITHVKAFLNLPSISCLSCKSLYMEKNKHQPGAAIVSCPSAIAELKFVDATLDLTALSELLQSSSSLKHFTYAYEAYAEVHDRDETLARGPLNMIPALGRSAGHCLESLRVLDFQRAVTLEPGIFKDFRSLKELEINPIALQGEQDGSRFGGVARMLPACVQKLSFCWNRKSPFRSVHDIREYLLLLMQEANDVPPLLQKISVFGQISKRDEDTLRIDNELCGWRLYASGRHDAAKNDEELLTFCSFCRTTKRQ